EPLNLQNSIQVVIAKREEAIMQRLIREKNIREELISILKKLKGKK
ncbi:10134_t:CDS:1, partial [Scutellospora calospora]